MPSWPILQEKFLTNLKAAKNLSDNTILAYRNDLKSLEQHLRHTYEIHDLHQIQGPHLRDWLVSLRKTGESSSTIKRRISSIKQFFSYSVRLNEIQHNPSADLVSPRLERILPDVLPSQDLINVLNRLSEDKTYETQRNYIILYLMYCCGLRKAEVVDLLDSSIDIENHYIRILGKGSKERLVPLPDIALRKIKDYIDIRKKHFGRYYDDFLFLSLKGSKIYPKLVYNIVNKHFAVLNKGNIHPHLLRHSFATHLLSNGAKIEYVRKLLGHTSLAATQIYTQLSIEQLQEEYKKRHPRS